MCPFLLFGQAKKILFTNGYLHVGNGQVIETALLGVVDGKISLVKNVLTSTYKRRLGYNHRVKRAAYLSCVCCAKFYFRFNGN